MARVALSHWRTAAYLLVVVATAYGFWVNHVQDIERCRARNESTERSVHIMAEALVAAATDAPPQRVQGFLDDLDARLARERVDCT